MSSPLAFLPRLRLPLRGDVDEHPCIRIDMGAFFEADEVVRSQDYAERESQLGEYRAVHVRPQVRTLQRRGPRPGTASAWR